MTENSDSLTIPDSLIEVKNRSGLKFNGGKLFNLCLNIQTGFPLLDKPRKYLDSLLPDTAQFILISSTDLIHPEEKGNVPIESILDTVKHSEPGIFCRKLESNRWDHNQRTALAAVSLGDNKVGQKSTAAILYDSNTTAGKTRDQFCNLLVTLQKFYDDLNRSTAVQKFMDNRLAFRYLVDADTAELVAKRLPTGVEQADESLAESIYNQVLSGNLSEENSPAFGKRIKNYNITHFRLDRFKFYLLSFEIIRAENKESSYKYPENDKLIQCFVQKIKNKLASLQAAASQLEFQAGKIIDNDDMALAGIIRNDTEFINRMATRLRQYCEIKEPFYRKFDIIKLINTIISRQKKSANFNRDFSFSSNADFGTINGDFDQIENALIEIFKNVFESGGDVSIDICYGDKIALVIRNSLQTEDYNRLKNKNLDIFESFVSLRQNKIGLGLSIANKIIGNHAGSIRIRINSRLGMITKITLPT